MLSRKSKSEIPLPKRPEPPNVQQIIEDIQNSDKNDIIFRLQKDGERGKDSTSMSYGPGETPLLMSESFHFEDKSPESNAKAFNPLLSPADSHSSEASGPSQPDVDAIYSQALQFIRLSEKLKQSPDQLQQLYDHLQGLEGELTDCIDNLKQKSQTMEDRLSPKKD